VCRYITGATHAKYRAPLIAKGLGVQTTGGTQGFHGGPWHDVYKEIARHYAAFLIAASDPDIIEVARRETGPHGVERYYLSVADRQHRQRLEESYGRVNPVFYDGDILDHISPTATEIYGKNLIEGSQESTPEPRKPSSPTATEIYGKNLIEGSIEGSSRDRTESSTPTTSSSRSSPRIRKRTQEEEDILAFQPQPTYSCIPGREWPLYEERQCNRKKNKSSGRQDKG
jgi:hypothetical protein